MMHYEKLRMNYHVKLLSLIILAVRVGRSYPNDVNLAHVK